MNEHRAPRVQRPNPQQKGRGRKDTHAPRKHETSCTLIYIYIVVHMCRNVHMLLSGRTSGCRPQGKKKNAEVRPSGTHSTQGNGNRNCAPSPPWQPRRETARKDAHVLAPPSLSVTACAAFRATPRHSLRLDKRPLLRGKTKKPPTRSLLCVYALTLCCASLAFRFHRPFFEVSVTFRRSSQTPRLSLAPCLEVLRLPTPSFFSENAFRYAASPALIPRKRSTLLSPSNSLTPRCRLPGVSRHPNSVHAPMVPPPALLTCALPFFPVFLFSLSSLP